VAKHVIEELIDDLDGGEADVTVRIGWEGEWRELDLSEKNLDAFAKVFDPYWDAGRGGTEKNEASGRRRRSNGSGSKRQGGRRDYDRGEFKTWAVENDIRLNRGRPPRELIDRFLAEADGK